MNQERTILLVFGFVREYYTSLQRDLPPHDIIKLFSSWLSFSDYFDPKLSHPTITIELVKHDQFGECQKLKSTAKDFELVSAIGNAIIMKGEKQRWVFQINNKSGFAGTSLIIGIIDAERVKSVAYIEDFTDSENKGYGLHIRGMFKYHASDLEIDGHFEYGYQFECKEDDLITMELDLTQEDKDDGILRYIIHSASKHADNEISMEGQYSNILYDNIDINRKWRAAVSFENHDEDVFTLLPVEYYNNGF